MILRHYKLREQPFGVTPDPRFLYASASHREALSALLYGIESGLGFVTLTAKPGMGKTTLIFETLRRVRDSKRTVFLFQTISSPHDLLRALLIDLGVKDLDGGIVEMQTQLNELLVAQSATGKRLVVVIDEAQNLDEQTLEAVRMLSNFETARHKLLQIVLAGQPQLADKLALPELLQLRQRISIFGHLKPFTAAETAAYIQHRLKVAGHESDEPLFTESALTAIAAASEGIPRNINNICFNALSLGCAKNSRKIDAEMVEEVLRDLQMDGTQSPLPFASSPIFAPAIEKERSEQDRSDKDRNGVRNFSLAAACLCLCVGVGWYCSKDSGATMQALFSRPVQAFHQGPAAAEKATEPPTGPVSTRPETKSAVPASPATGVAIANGGGLSADSRAAQETSQLRTVVVHDGQSLFAICQEAFGDCRPELLKQIIKLNAKVPNPDHIESGQTIYLPDQAPLLRDTK